LPSAAWIVRTGSSGERTLRAFTRTFSGWFALPAKRTQSTSPGRPIVPSTASGAALAATVACAKSSFGSLSEIASALITLTATPDGAEIPSCSGTSHVSEGPPGSGCHFCVNVPFTSPRSCSSDSTPGLPPGGNATSGRGKVPTCSR
jgi:hypothetical protein